MKISKLYILSIVFLLAQCAKQTQPTGGAKDDTPPKLIRSNPADRQTNFKQNEIELYFDEMIQVNGAREQLIITPAVGKKFEAEARKNKVTLKLNADLKENTTYTISFRDAIQDVTERNSVVNLKLAFSTGDHIDSLSISGMVYNPLEDKALKNYTVAAVLHHDTINIFKHEAQWITFTNEKGEYILDNLKAGTYTLYTFEDKNKNLIVDSKTESYGFIGETLSITEGNIKKNIPVVRLDSRDLKLISSRPIATYFNIRVTKGIKEYTLLNTTNDSTLYHTLEDASTIKVFNTIHNLDSIGVKLSVKDSIGNQLDTLLNIKFDTRSTSREKFTAKVEYLDFLKNKSLLKGEINFSKPVGYVLIDSFFIKLDSANFLRFSKADYTFDEHKTQLTFEKKLTKEIDFTTQRTPQSRGTRERSVSKEEPKSQVKEIPLNNLIVPKGSIISIEYDTASTIQSPIRVITPENSGTIILETDSKDEEQVIIQIVDKSFKVVQSSISKKARFENLPPADYMIRVIVDTNANQSWDAGNYFKRIEPERIIYYKNEKGNPSVNLKANWEVGPLLISTQQTVENPKN
ncbi:MAG: Ig-like domain-containing protein [Cyclobacteriaceae bacterium]|nr:Ig-like domain-containing protein [Cyclobacteriaceae bacterium]UYN86873.1 MAG: Ig-like domain-containing protein [Cyclobacteriaceae bacterium]